MANPDLQGEMALKVHQANQGTLVQQVVQVEMAIMAIQEHLETMVIQEASQNAITLPMFHHLLLSLLPLDAKM